MIKISRYILIVVFAISCMPAQGIELTSVKLDQELVLKQDDVYARRGRAAPAARRTVKTVPVARKTVPAVRRTAPATRKAVPVARKAVPVARKTVPVARKTVPVVRKTVAVVRKTVPVIRRTVPAAPIIKNKAVNNNIDNVDNPWKGAVVHDNVYDNNHIINDNTIRRGPNR
mgnify:FL=1